VGLAAPAVRASAGTSRKASRRARAIAGWYPAVDSADRQRGSR
jgi:hypothetical protein